MKTNVQPSMFVFPFIDTVKVMLEYGVTVACVYTFIALL